MIITEIMGLMMTVYLGKIFIRSTRWVNPRISKENGGRKRYIQVMDNAARKEVALYIENANEALSAAQLNLDNDFYTAAINRAYYAIFYGANALLATKKLARSKHSGVLAAFRQHFIKTGILASELSEIYGQVLDDRQESDYEIITATSKEDAEIDIHQPRHFVEAVSTWVQEGGWL